MDKRNLESKPKGNILEIILITVILKYDQNNYYKYI